MADRIDTDTPETPGWYLRNLMGELHNVRTGRGVRGRRWRRDAVASSKVRPPLDLLDDYRRGDPPLREDIHTGWAAPFRQYVRMGRLNFAGKLVTPTANRMGIRGFRTAAAEDELGDIEARKIMRRNGLKTVARDVHDNMLSLRTGYTMVTPPDADRDWSLITAESPLQCITGHDPATGATKAGLKVFRDDWDSYDWAYLYLPGELWVARKPGPSSLGGRGGFRFGDRWEWDVERFDDIPGQTVPLVRFRNQRGVSEFEEHLDQLDRINDKIFNEWWIEKIQAFRQRAIQREKDAPDEDYEDTQDAEDAAVSPSMSPDEVADLFVSAPDALWDLPPGAKMWESGTVDVGPMLQSIQKELMWLAAAADKPLNALNPDAANQTAEGSSNQKEEHLYQVEDRRDRAEPSWAETMRLAFLYQGDRVRADVTALEVLWGPIERYSLSQKAAAANNAGKSLPRSAIRRDIWQYDPAELPELQKLDGQDLLVAQRPPAEG